MSTAPAHRNEPDFLPYLSFERSRKAEIVATHEAMEEAGARGSLEYGSGLEVHDVNKSCLLQRFQLRSALGHAQPHGALDGRRRPCVDLGLSPAGFEGLESVGKTSLQSVGSRRPFELQPTDLSTKSTLSHSKDSFGGVRLGESVENRVCKV